MMAVYDDHAVICLWMMKWKCIRLQGKALPPFWIKRDAICFIMWLPYRENKNIPIFSRFPFFTCPLPTLSLFQATSLRLALLSQSTISIHNVLTAAGRCLHRPLVFCNCTWLTKMALTAKIKLLRILSVVQCCIAVWLVVLGIVERVRVRWQQSGLGMPVWFGIWVRKHENWSLLCGKILFCLEFHRRFQFQWKRKKNILSN